MTIHIERKILNEKDNFDIDIFNDEREVVSPYDETVIELCYEILKDKDLS